MLVFLVASRWMRLKALETMSCSLWDAFKGERIGSSKSASSVSSAGCLVTFEATSVAGGSRFKGSGSSRCSPECYPTSRPPRAGFGSHSIYAPVC